MKTWLDLTERFPVRFDVERMKADLVNFQNSAAWLSHYDQALSQGWRAILLKSKNGDVSGPASQYPSGISPNIAARPTLTSSRISAS